MRDSARQPAERFHFVRLAQLQFQGSGACNIPKAPHPTHDLVVDALGLRVALENAAVLELNSIESGGGRCLSQFLYPCEENIRVLDLIRNLREKRLVIRPQQTIRTQMPHLSELLVATGDLSIVRYDEDAVRGGFQSRIEQRDGLLQLALGLPAGPILDSQLGIDPREHCHPPGGFLLRIFIGAVDRGLHFLTESQVAARKHHRRNAGIEQSIIGDDFKWNPRTGPIPKPEDRRDLFALALNGVGIVLRRTRYILGMDKFEYVSSFQLL